MESEALHPLKQVPACFQVWTDLLQLDSPSSHTHPHMEVVLPFYLKGFPVFSFFLSFFIYFY